MARRKAGDPPVMHVAVGALAAALAAATPGDTLELASGVHPGPVEVRVPVVLRGAPGAILRGPGTGSVLLVTAHGTVVEDLRVEGSGRRVLTIDSAVQVIRAANVTLRRLVVADALYGVYAERAAGLVVEDSKLEGRVRPMQEDGEGNGIHLWYCPTPRLVRNDVERFADGIYLSFVHEAHVEGNRLHDCGRYGLHTMYCQRNDLLRNRFTRNVAGCAIMFSNHLRVAHNDLWRNRGPRTYGLLLRDCSDGEFFDNRMVDNTIAVFLDNSNRNRIHDNLVEDNGWGFLVFSSCAQNVVTGNTFVNNDYPVALDMRFTTNRFDDGHRGNYWSENAPYDLDADGTSDVPYSPVGAFAFLSKQYPDLTILSRSPSVVALTAAERTIPALRPSEALDRFPLLAPVPAHGTGEPLDADRRGAPAWPFAAVYGALLAGGLAGFAARRSAA